MKDLKIIDDVINKVQLHFKEYFESQEDSMGREFKNYIILDKPLVIDKIGLNKTYLFKNLPIEIVEYFESQLKSLEG